MIERFRASRWLRILLMATIAVTVNACAEPRFDRKTERQWLAQLRAGDVTQRQQAVDALGNLKAASDETRHALLAALDDSSLAVSAAAARALAHLSDGRTNRDVALPVLWRLAADADLDGRLVALETLGLEAYRDARSVPVLVAALRDSSTAIRATAATTLGQLGKRAASAMPALASALADSSEMVRHEARDAIAAITGRRGQH